MVYRSGSEMLTALLRNEADTAVITVSTALGQISEGKVRALAGVSMQSMKQLPDTPPVGKTIPGFDVAVWHGIAGPTGMDAALVTRINGIFDRVLQVPAVRAANIGLTGCRYRRRHSATIRCLHQKRAEAMAGGCQSCGHQIGLVFNSRRGVSEAGRGAVSLDWRCQIEPSNVQETSCHASWRARRPKQI